MKTLVILLFVILPGLVIAQDQSIYRPIDQVGWELPDFSLLEDLDPVDHTGSAKFLLVLNKKGLVKKVKILSSSFSQPVGAMLMEYLEGKKLARKPNDQNLLRYKGILDMSMEPCFTSTGN